MGSLGSPTKKAKIAIAGAGVAGTFLFKYLKKYGFDVDIYEIDRAKLGCYCAWGVEQDNFYKIMRLIDVKGEDYLLCKILGTKVGGETVLMDNFITIDKKKLMTDLVGDDLKIGNITLDDYEIIIDATGVNRAYLGPIDKAYEDAVLLPDTYQIRDAKRECKEEEFVRFTLMKVGYSWEFPLGKRGWHYGYGDLGGGKMAWSVKGCECMKKIRFGPTRLNRPFTRGKIWGVGEAIGTVSPTSGEGIIPSLECAIILGKMIVDRWNLEGYYCDKEYERKVLEKFKYMNISYRAVQGMWGKGLWKLILPFTLAKTLGMEAKKLGMQMTLKKKMKMLWIALMRRGKP